MKKTIALALCLLFMVSGHSLALAQENGGMLDSFFRNVGDFLADILDPSPSTGDALNIDTLSQIRDHSGGLKLEDDNYLQAVDTASLRKSDSVTIGGVDYAFWPQSSKATDKIISVKNSARESVYFRAAILIKCKDHVWQNMHLNRNENPADYTWIQKQVVIDGVSYPMLVATYQRTLNANEVSPPLLMQIAIDRSAISGLDTFDFKTQVFAIQASAFGDHSIDSSLNAAIPLENIAASFGGTLKN